MDDMPIPIVKCPQAHEYAQLLSNFEVEHPMEFAVVDVRNIQSFLDKLNNLLIFNINKHQ